MSNASSRKCRETLYTTGRKSRGWLMDIDLVSSRSQHHAVGWNKEGTRWLGVYLDHSLNFTAHRNEVVAKAKSAEGRLRSLINKFGIPPVSARNVQVAVVQSTLLYGAELWWNGNTKVTRQFQLTINRLVRGTLGCFRSTPLGPLLTEANMMPAIPLLNYWQTRYAHQLLRMTHGPRHILSTRSDFSSRLWDAVLLPHELDQIEEALRLANMTFPSFLLPKLNLEDALMMRWHASAKNPPVGELNEVRLFYAPSARSASSAKQPRICRASIKHSRLHRGTRGWTNSSRVYRDSRGYVGPRPKNRGFIEALEVRQIHRHFIETFEV
jgi:hypothetical protein